MQNKITRRGFITAAGTAAALAATAAISSGCSAPEKEQQQVTADTFDYINQFLPLGSVVTLTPFPDWVKFMIVMRRPTSTVDENGKLTAGTSTKQGWDYGAVIWPFSYMGNLAEETLNQETYPFSRDKIAKVDFLGYQDETELEAEDLLNQNMSSKLSGFDILAEKLEAFQKAMASEG